MKLRDLTEADFFRGINFILDFRIKQLNLIEIEELKDQQSTINLLIIKTGLNGIFFF